MRQARTLALLVVPILLAACSGSHHASGGPPDRAVHPPTQFGIRPNIADPLCNGGHGLRLSARLGGTPLVAAGAMEDGSTLITVSDYATKNTVDLYAVSRSCVPVREFGTAGRATVTPSSRPPAHSDTLPDALWVNAVTPREGGALIAGAYRGRWMVGAVTPQGRVDPTFGSGGWAVLPFRGEVTAIVQTPSGRIVIGGDNAGGGCCLVNWAAALSARGQLERAFGKDGRTKLRAPALEAGIGALVLRRNGDILAAVGYGNNGCWGVALDVLTPSGHPVPRFARRTDRFWHGLGLNAFVGDIYINDDGFTLVGTGQRPCVGPPATASAPSATGLIARFRKDGQLADPIVRFPSRMSGTVWALRKDNDTVVITSPYADPTHLALAALHPDGSLDPRFGSQGRARIRTPWRGRDDTTVVIIRAPPRAITVVAARGGLNHLQIVRVLL